MKYKDYRISPALKKSLEELGFNRPTDIQYKSIPHILKGEDVLGIAQTGTGKTAAFAIPILHKVEETKRRGVPAGIRCLVMVPTRELALQITEVFERLGQYMQVCTFCVFGGVEQGPQIARLEKGIDILVVTPGRMFDLVSQGYIHLGKVDILVLDEADHMLDLGFIKDIQDLIRFLPKKRQTLFFSATIDENIKKLAYSLVHKPIRIQISPKDPVSKNVDHSVAYIAMDDKRFFLERLVKEYSDKKILVFVRTKVRAERVVKAMERVGLRALAIHGDKDQKERMKTLRSFSEGEVKTLIATDVSARGIDIPGVAYVVNYDLPEQTENYVHRVGRTGRGKERGMAVSFCSPQEKPLLEKIEGFLESDIKVMDIDSSDYEDTLDLSAANPYDWKSLIKEEEERANMPKKKNRPKKKR